MSLDLKASLFGAYAAVGQSATTSVATQYATDTTISLGLNYPEQIGNTFSYAVQPYFFKAINVDKCDFIPTKYRTYQTFQPFLVTYHSDGTVGAATGPELTLDLTGKTVNVGEKVQLEVTAKKQDPDLLPVVLQRPGPRRADQAGAHHLQGQPFRCRWLLRHADQRAWRHPKRLRFSGNPGRTHRLRHAGGR